jgi:golgi SNAP receptor complex member 1
MAIQQTKDREALTRSLHRPRSTQPIADTDRLITERDRIDHSHSITDSVLQTAYATRTEFGRQRQALSRINERLFHSASIVH